MAASQAELRRFRFPASSFQWWLAFVMSCLSLLSLTPASPRSANQSQEASKDRPTIVSLIPAVTEMLYAIGAGPQVIAVSSFDRYPPAVEKLPRVGALLDPDLEKILSLRPDLVVIYGSQTELRDQLRRADIPTFAYTHAGLPEVTATMRELGRRTGRMEEADAAAAVIEQRLEEVRGRVAGRPRRTTMVVFGREERALRGIYASGGVGFIHDMLVLAGGTNVFADVKRESMQVSTELIIARRPGAIVELRFAPLTPTALAAEMTVWKTLGAVPAVRNGRVHIIADEKMVVPGPRVAEASQLLAKALHPEVW